jgi:hypothetical protein
MVIDLTKNNSISALNNFDPDICIKYYQALGLDHSSPSQDQLTTSDWIVRYCFFTQEQRRALQGSYRMSAGVSIGRASQKYVSKYMYEAEKKILNEKKDLDIIIKEELTEYDKYVVADEEDKIQKEDTKNYLADMIKLTCKALADLKLGDEVASERYCTYKFKELVLDKIGRIDYEQMDTSVSGIKPKLVELKTKHRSKRKSDTKQGYSWIKGYLPKQPDINHVKQCAFYWYATKKTPHLLYVNQDSYNIFTPDTCELLTPEYMEFLVQQDLITAKIRQNLVYITKGNPFDMAKLVPPPDFSGFMWKNIADEHVRLAASLWDNV